MVDPTLPAKHNMHAQYCPGATYFPSRVQLMLVVPDAVRGT
jgi:hypothetical protein